MSYKFQPTATVGYNLLPTKTTPLDTRQVVSLKSDLTTISYTYQGMIVSVVDDNSSNNGAYLLVASDSTDSQNWTKLKVAQDPALAQIIKDNTSITVTDADAGDASSTMVFTVDGSPSMTVNSTSLVLEQGQTIGTLSKQIGDIRLASNADVYFDTTALSLESNALFAGTDGTIDLGSSQNQWNDLYLSGDINLASGGNITVGGVPFGVPTLTLALDVKNSSGWDSYDSTTDRYLIDSGTLSNKDGGTIVVDNEKSGELLAFEFDTTNILDDTQKFMITAKSYKAAAVKLINSANSIVYGTTTTAGDTIFVGNGQVLELWRQGGNDYFAIRSA